VCFGPNPQDDPQLNMGSALLAQISYFPEEKLRDLQRPIETSQGSATPPDSDSLEDGKLPLGAA